MAKETIVSKFTLKGREILSSYANFTLEGVMTAKVECGAEKFTIEERNGIAKGTSDGENEAIYIANDKAIKSIEKNIVPLLPRKVVITKPSDILDACRDFDRKLVEGAGKNKKTWGGNATLAASTAFFQTLLKASGYKAWQVFAPRGMKQFWMPNIGFNMVCGGEHVPGTKQDIQEMFLFVMNQKSVKGVFTTATAFFRQFEKNLVKDGLPTGTAKERGFVFPVADNNEGLVRIKKCAEQLKLGVKDYAIGTDNAFSEIQKGDLAGTDKYRMRFSQGEDSATITREQLVDFCGKIVESAPNFVTMEDPASEHDPIGHKLMSAKYGKRVQIVIDDLAVTQMRYILPFLASKEMKDRCGSSVLIKLNQAGTFTETCLAIEIVLGIADVAVVEDFLAVRGDLKGVIAELKKVGVTSVAEAIANIKKNQFTAFFSHRSTEGSSEFLPYLPLMYGAISPKVWFKAGAPNGERNLQNYNPLIRAEEEMLEAGINVQVTAWNGLPGVVTEVPALLTK